MKAYFSMSYGGPDKSTLGDISDPTPGKNQLLVEVKAVSVNPVDFKVKRGEIKFLSGSKFPKIVGSDFAGIVKSVPVGVDHLVPGDRVYGAVSVLFGKQGALAELVAVDVNRVSKIPERVTFTDAASLPIAALTALSAIRKCRVKAGTSVLINGSTGGVGHFAVQMARANGALVTASCNPRNTDFILNLGADHTIGYGDEILAGTTQKYDAIIDTHGYMPYRNIRRLLKRGGIYASTIPSSLRLLLLVPMRLIYGISLTSANMRGLPEDYAHLESLLTSGKVQPVIECPFTLKTAASAFALAERGGFRGKIVVTIP
jgi:NADPH:quinone reductase-like Zn-dependent oxidoreductase